MNHSTWVVVLLLGIVPYYMFNKLHSHSKYVAGYITTSSAEEAKKLAGELVRKKLCACVNIMPKVSSVYSWKGEIVQEEEALMMIKTTSNRKAEVLAYIKSAHSYSVPEVIFVPIESGSNPEYLNWVSEQTSS